MTYRTADEIKAANISAMGDALGSLYSELWQEVVYLHRKWMEYLALFGTEPARIALMNKAAPSFFRMVQDVLWEETLLHIARLTDPPESGKGKRNLTIQGFPNLVTDETLRKTIQSHIEKIVVESEFCRDWRNRRIAHRDLAIALDQSVTPLKNGSRKQVDQLLDMIAAVIEAVSLHYFDSGTYFRFDGNDGQGAIALLRILTDGVKMEAIRRNRLRKGRPLEEDWVTPDI